MKNHLNFPEDQKPSYERRRELLAALLTVTGLYPEKSAHLIMDADENLYRAKLVNLKEWEVRCIVHRPLPSAPF